MPLFVSAIAGLLFERGLLISGMAAPAKVQNFLDVFGAWDASLAFVMAGAVATALCGCWRGVGWLPPNLLSIEFATMCGAAWKRRLSTRAGVSRK